jgi:hypothetical protein
MASINGTTSYNVGTDASLAVTDDQGDAFPINALGHMLDFDSEADDTELKIVPITNGGKPLFQTVWAGGHGRITFARYNGNLQAMILQLMSAYHNIGLIPQFSLALAVLNRDGSVDEYLYTGVQWNKPKFGNFRALKEVDQMLDFSWSDCTLTGGASLFLPNVATG